jgi:hypothetical protein
MGCLSFGIFWKFFEKLSYICGMEKCRASWYKNKEGKIVRFRVCVNKSNMDKNHGLGYYRKMEIYTNNNKKKGYNPNLPFWAL